MAILCHPRQHLLNQPVETSPSSLEKVKGHVETANPSFTVRRNGRQAGSTYMGAALSEDALEGCSVSTIQHVRFLTSSESWETLDLGIEC